MPGHLLVISTFRPKAYDVSLRQTPEMVERGVPPGYNLKMLGKWQLSSGCWVPLLVDGYSSLNGHLTMETWGYYSEYH